MTYDARHAEQLAEIQTIAETIEILHANEDEARDHFSKTKSSSLLRPTCRAFPPLEEVVLLARGWRGVQNWKRQLFSAGCCKNYSQNIGHADEIVKVC